MRDSLWRWSNTLLLKEIESWLDESPERWPAVLESACRPLPDRRRQLVDLCGRLFEATRGLSADNVREAIDWCISRWAVALPAERLARIKIDDALVQLVMRGVRGGYKRPGGKRRLAALLCVRTGALDVGLCIPRAHPTDDAVNKVMRNMF
jgi:hypothetical protein